MKLAPRERTVRQNYLVQYADSLNLGKLYLGWDKKKTVKKPTKKTDTTPSSSNSQEKHIEKKKAARTPKAKLAPKKEAIPVVKAKKAPTPAKKKLAATAAPHKGQTTHPLSNATTTNQKVAKVLPGEVINPTIRLLNNTIFRIQVSPLMTLGDFKRVVLDRAYPERVTTGTATPMFVADGKPLNGEANTTLHALNVSDVSTVFLFPPVC